MTPRRKSDQGHINQRSILSIKVLILSPEAALPSRGGRGQFPWHGHRRFMVSSGPGAGEMLEVEGDGAAPCTIKNPCLSGLSGSLWAAWGGCHKSAHPCIGESQDGLKLSCTLHFPFLLSQWPSGSFCLTLPKERTIRNRDASGLFLKTQLS